MRKETEDLAARKRRPVNLTIRADVMKDAKAFKINASHEAEKAIVAAVKKAKEEEWIAENWDAIQAHNERIEREGLPIKPYWLGK
jgi:antitoxin CcdA